MGTLDRMSTCPRCGAELQRGARFCVMCGRKVELGTDDAVAGPFATSTLTGSGLTIAISAAAVCAVIAAGVFVLLRSLI